MPAPEKLLLQSEPFTVSHAPDTLVLSRTPSCLKFFAVVTLANAAGVGLMGLLPFLGVPVDVKVGDLDREAAVWMLAFFCGSVAVALGAIGIFMFSRWDTVIDRRHRIIIRRWRLLGWQRERRWWLEGMTHVELRMEGYRNACYPVLLCGDHREIPLVRHPRQIDGSGEIAARRDAHQVAVFLGLDLHDRTRDAYGDSPTVSKAPDAEPGAAANPA